MDPFTLLALDARSGSTVCVKQMCFAQYILEIHLANSLVSATSNVLRQHGAAVAGIGGPSPFVLAAIHGEPRLSADRRRQRFPASLRKADRGRTLPPDPASD